MSSEDLERFEAEIELALYREYRDVIGMFRYVVEIDRRSYLANKVTRHSQPGDDVQEVTLEDAWVWDIYRPSRFVTSVTISTAKGIAIERLPEREL